VNTHTDRPVASPDGPGLEAVPVRLPGLIMITVPGRGLFILYHFISWCLTAVATTLWSTASAPARRGRLESIGLPVSSTCV
jgi:hypothetical protein